MALVVGGPAAGWAGDRNGDYAIVGYGSYACSSLSQDIDAGVANWVAGYLTAINQLYDGVYDLKGDQDLDGVVDWIYTYCSSHPNDGVATAASAFVKVQASSQRREP